MMMKWKGCGRFGALSQNFPGRFEENDGNPFRTVDIPAEILTGYLLVIIECVTLFCE
jgi:hypothetical protein